MPSARIGDISMYYEIAGSGEPLVLLHGIGSSGRDWEHQVPVFAAHFSVITPDLRGFGATDKPAGEYRIERHAADIVGLLDHLGIDRCHVLGFSMGGAVAFQLAVDVPQRLDSMVILNSQPSYALDHWSKYLYVISRLGMTRLVGLRRMTRYVAKRLFPEPHQEYLRQQMLERHGRNDQRAYRRALFGMRGWSVADRLAQIEVPTLVIAAENDYTPLEDKRVYAQRLPNGRFVTIPDSRHATHFDQPGRFNKLVVEFLLEHRTQTARRGYRQRLANLLRPLARMRTSTDAACD